MLTRCSYCNKKIAKQKRSMQRYNHNFCNMTCYFNYRKEHPEEYVQKTKQDNSSLRKIRKLAEINKKFINKEYY